MGIKKQAPVPTLEEFRPRVIEEIRKLHEAPHTIEVYEQTLTDFGAAGADAFTIQTIAGHASVTTSQRYIHPLPETIQRAVARLEQYRRTEAAAQRPSLSVVPKSGVPAIVSATVPVAQGVAVGK